MARPYPGGPMAAVAMVDAYAELMVAVSDAARARLGDPALAAYQIGVFAAHEDGMLREAWTAAPDGARRDVMTTVAELAVRAGADPADLEPAADTATHMWLAARLARSLYDLAVEELAKADRPGGPARSLAPDVPWELATGATGVYAMSTVCDSAEPEVAKIAAVVALSAAAHRAIPPEVGHG
jgi:hypothetical protein